MLDYLIKCCGIQVLKKELNYGTSHPPKKHNKKQTKNNNNKKKKVDIFILLRSDWINKFCLLLQHRSWDYKKIIKMYLSLILITVLLTRKSKNGSREQRLGGHQLVSFQFSQVMEVNWNANSESNDIKSVLCNGIHVSFSISSKIQQCERLFFSFCKKGRWGAWGAWQLTTKPSLGPHLSSSQLMCAIVPLHYQWIWSLSRQWKQSDSV